MFKIPIENFEEDMHTEAAKEKKKEILNLFTNYNKLRSEAEFEEIEDYLHSLCRKGDVESIKFYLSETVENDTKDLLFKIDEINRTASLFKINNNNNDSEVIIIPRTVQHKSTEYLITSIRSIFNKVKSIKFVEDSAVRTFYRDAFLKSNIEEIYFPSSLKELKEGWCFHTYKLRKITISPSNGQFKFIDDKYLLGKSDSNKDEFDIILFVNRNIEEISIPSNIKIISSFAFQYCQNLTKIEFEPNSNLQIIGKYAFHESRINEIFISSKVSKIGEYAFKGSFNLTKVEFEANSNLQTIENSTFSSTNINEFFIPSKVSKICENAFSSCIKLTKIEFEPNSNLQIIESNAFNESMNFSFHQKCQKYVNMHFANATVLQKSKFQQIQIYK